MKQILFRTPMVQAIDNGRKTQTRRVITNPKTLDFILALGADKITINNHTKINIGDILYVKETYCDTAHNGRIIYKASVAENDMGRYRWKPSLFMPKTHARIFLKITNVRAERLQDISEEDAIAEGVKVREGNPMFYRVGEFSSTFSAREVFIHLWSSINKKEPTKQWEANPYVSVYEFERVEKPEVME